MHNQNTNKLIKLDRLLNIEDQWTASEADLESGSSGNSCLTTNSDGSVVFWYRGSHECLMLNVETKNILEEFDYICDECKVMVGMKFLEKENLLLSVTNNQAGNDSKLTLFDVKKHKITSKFAYSALTDGKKMLIEVKDSISTLSRCFPKTNSSYSQAIRSKVKPSCLFTHCLT